MKTIKLSILLISILSMNNINAQMEKDKPFFSKKVRGTFEEVYSKVNQSIESNGFGVVTELNMDKKLKEKLDVSIGNYHILGICNPKLAYDAIQIEENIGVFLPCKLVIRKVKDGEFEVATFNPSIMMGVLENPELDKVALHVSQKLQDILEGI